MAIPVLEITIIVGSILIIYLLYKYISKYYPLLKSRRYAQNQKNDAVKNQHEKWEAVSRLPDHWKEMVRNILEHYLSSIHLSLEPNMTLRYCLEVLQGNKRDDPFLYEMVDFLEKWHFSDWQPDQKIIQSWFTTIKEKAEYFQTMKMEFSHEKLIA